MTEPLLTDRIAGREVPQPTVDAGEGRARESSELRSRLAQLARSRTFALGEVAPVIAELTELGCALLGCERASVWQLSQAGDLLECQDAYSRARREHLRPEPFALRLADCPRFVAALAEERAVALHDVRLEPAAAELAPTYFAALGVGACVAAPIVVRGRWVGLVAVEHVGEARRWQLVDELTVATLADLAALLLAAREQQRSETQLGALRARIDEMLESRTNQVVRENADLQREVDALHDAADAIRKSEDDLRRLFAASPVPLLLIRRADQRVLFANQVAARALGAVADELHEQPVGTLFAHRSDLGDLLDALERVAGDEPREVQLKTRQGETFWALLSGRRALFSAIDAVLLGFSDLTSQKAVEHQLRVLAQRDPLTQAYNRHHFWQLAHSEMARVKRYRRPLSLAMIDADHFKQINDVYGHDVGDSTLRMIVDVCHDSLRKNDVLARYGGEEFVVLLPETPVEGALAVVERLRERIAQSPLALEDGRTIPVTVSVGLAGIVGPEESLEALLKRADDALYAAKRAGRNRVQLA